MMIFMQSRDLMNEWARRYVAVMIADITVGREIDASQKLMLRRNWTSYTQPTICTVKNEVCIPH